jgi:hypothetical protein
LALKEIKVNATTRTAPTLGAKLEPDAGDKGDAEKRALAALREDTQKWWADLLARNPDELDEGEKPATADPMVCAAFWRARCCRGWRTARRNSSIAR